MEKIASWDESLFLWLNEMNSPVWDQIMFTISSIPFWIWFYLLLIGYSIWKYKVEGALIITGIIISVIFCDQITASFMKPFFGRLRPSHDPEINSLVHLVNDYRGGLYSFASSHAANTFTLATYFWLNLRKKEKWPVYLFLWAAVVSYSRIYLGVHYPGDIIVGALVGIGIANLVSFAMNKYVVNLSFVQQLNQKYSKRIQ